MYECCMYACGDIPVVDFHVLSVEEKDCRRKNCDVEALHINRYAIGVYEIDACHACKQRSCFHELPQKIGIRPHIKERMIQRV